MNGYNINYHPNKSQIVDFIKKNHYTGSCIIAPSYVMALEDDGVLIGACVFSVPSRQHIQVPNIYLLLELNRMFILDCTPKNTESWFLSKCLKWLKKNTTYEAVVSFADVGRGHVGTIYKAANFTLLGSTSKNYHYVDNSGVYIHKRKIWDRAKSLGLLEKEYANQNNLTKISDPPKNKYVYYLKSLKNRYLIYGLKDPNTGEVRYVGKSEQGSMRWVEHIKPSSLKGDNHKSRWIKGLVDVDQYPEMIVLEILKSKEELFNAEAKWVAHYRNIGAPLTNITDGGDGTNGYTHTPETKDKIRSRKKGRKLSHVVHNKKEHIYIDGIESRHCFKCNEYRNISEFKKTKNRWIAYCRLCRNALNRLHQRKKYVKLSLEEYKKARLKAAHKGGEATKAKWKLT